MDDERQKLKNKYHVIIVGTGAAGLFCALALNPKLSVLLVTKKGIKDCNSYLAQGGMCVLRDPDDFEDFMADTLKAGHYENREESVRTMILRSRDILQKLLDYRVDFDREGQDLSYTREGGHGKRRIVHCKDETGKAIVEKLVDQVLERKNIQVLENTEMVDLMIKEGTCYGACLDFHPGGDSNKSIQPVFADFTVLATGGIGGLYENSTNFPHICGDSLGILRNYQVKTDHLDYIQFHPTTLFVEEEDGRRRLMTEALRGEGAYLLDRHGHRFTDELQPRDIVTGAIRRLMEKEKTDHVYLSMAHLDPVRIKNRFPYIYAMCLERGYDLTRDSIPIVPGQHYHMGGIHVDQKSRTSIDRLYAVGECACNGVHGKNRLASNSLLESMVFAQIIAEDIGQGDKKSWDLENLSWPLERDWVDFREKNQKGLREAIEKNRLEK